jgi:hypothetical protein
LTAPRSASEAKERQVKVDDIRDAVQRMWLTTPEAEVLGCIALALADILESVTEILESVNVAAAEADKLAS